MKMDMHVMDWGGQDEALIGMALSHGLVNFDSAVNWEQGIWNDQVFWEKVVRRARLLAPMDGGHNKFLESLIFWVLIKAPRYWWQEFDTYRHVSKQSESTMHTITKHYLSEEDFEGSVQETHIYHLNYLIMLYKEAVNPDLKDHCLRGIKANLPEGFLQTRMVRLDGMTLRNIWKQRRRHRLGEWQFFLEYLQDHIPETDWEWITATKEETDANTQ